MMGKRELVASISLFLMTASVQWLFFAVCSISLWCYLILLTCFSPNCKLVINSTRMKTIVDHDQFFKGQLILIYTVCNCSMFCFTLLYVHSSIAIILMGKIELVSLLNLSSWCLVTVEWLFLPVSWGCLRFMIVVFPDHTHLLFSIKKY